MAFLSTNTFLSFKPVTSTVGEFWKFEMLATLTSLFPYVSESVVANGISISLACRLPALTLIFPPVTVDDGFDVVFPASSTVVTFTSVFTYW